MQPNVLSVEGISSARLDNGNFAIGLFFTDTAGLIIDGTSVGPNAILTVYTPSYSLTWSGPGAVPYS